MSNKKQSWREKFDKKFIWYNKENEREEFYEQDVKSVRQFIEKTLQERDNEVLKLLDDMEETNEDVWTGHEVKQEIRKFLKEL